MHTIKFDEEEIFRMIRKKYHLLDIPDEAAINVTVYDDLTIHNNFDIEVSW